MNVPHAERSVVAVAYPVTLLVMAGAVLVNATVVLATDTRLLPVTVAISIVVLLLVGTLAWRSRGGHGPTVAEARFTAVLALALVLIGFALNGPVVVMLAPLGMVCAYALMSARFARWLGFGYALLGAVMAIGFEPRAVFVRTFVTLLGLWILTDRVAITFVHQADALRAAAGALEHENDRLGEVVAERTRSLLRSRDALITAMSSLAAQRSLELAGHAERVEGLMRVLAERYQARHGAARALDDTWVDDVVRAAPLHDIGKLGIPEALLAKVEPLTAGDVAVIQGHCRIGRDVIDRVIERSDPGTPYLAIARSLIYAHHEHWDGSGYPEGLAGEAIPLPARLMAVVDVYDALTSERAYKSALPTEAALAEIRAGRGSHFDPEVVDAFLAFAPPAAATI